MGTRTFPIEHVARSLSTSLTAAVASFDRSRWDLKPSTKTSYFKTFSRFGRFVERELGRAAQLGDLVDDNVNAFLAQEADRKTMARNDCIALRQLAQWATKNGIFPRDPLAAVELPKGRGGKRKPFADADVKAIIAAASDSKFGPRDRAVIVVGLAAALRPAEIWQLRLSDVNLGEGWLTVRLETTKSDAGQRTIPLDPQAIAALDEYVHDYRGTRDGPLFLSARGDAFTYWGFMALFARLSHRLEERGVDFSAYRMRHTGITNWVRAGVETLVVKQLAGHKSVVTTQRYVGELTREDLARIPSAFTRIYGRVAS